MIYQASITTPANTAKSSPLRTEISVTSGLVYKVTFDFPPGSSGLLHLMVKDEEYQVWPTTIDEWFSGDNLTLEWDELFNKSEAPYRFIAYSYNEDDTYAHLCKVMIAMVSEKEYMARFLPGMAISDMQQMMVEVQAEQTAKRSARVARFVESVSTEGN